MRRRHWLLAGAGLVLLGLGGLGCSQSDSMGAKPASGAPGVLASAGGATIDPANLPEGTKAVVLSVPGMT